MACVEEVQIVKEKASGVEIEISNGNKNQKLKPLPAGLLNRMLRSTNTNKFEFMKNPEMSAPSKAAAVRCTASSRGRPNVTRGSDVSMVSEGVTSEEASVGGRTSTGSSITSDVPERVVRVQAQAQVGANVLDLRDEEAQEDVPEDAPVPKEMEEPAVVQEPELHTTEEKDNAVGFDIVFSPQARGPSDKLKQRLQKSRAPKKKRVKKDSEDEEEDMSNSANRFNLASTRKNTKAGKRFGNREKKESSEKSPDEDMNGSMFEVPPTPKSTSAKRQGGFKGPEETVPIGVGVGIEDSVQEEQAVPHLSEEDRDACGTWIQLLGLQTVKLVLSKHWNHRLEGLQNVSKSIQKYKNAKNALKVRLFTVYLDIAERRLVDNVLQVFITTVEVSKSLLEFGEDLESHYAVDALERLVPIALKRAGEANQRICNVAQDFLLWVTRRNDTEMTNVVAKFVTQPVADAFKAFKHVIARLNFITAFVDEFGFQMDRNLGLSAECVNRFVLDAVESANRRVCQDAAKVMELIYKKLGLKAIHLLNTQVKDNASEEYLQRALGPLIQSLMQDAGSETSRVRHNGSDALLALAMHEKIGCTFITKFCCQPPKDLNDQLALTGRTEVLSRMVSTIGCKAPAGVNLETVMLFAMTAVQSTFEPVRRSGTALVMACHKQAGDDVWDYIVHQDNEYVEDLKKRVIMQAKNSFRGGSSVKARLASEVGIARAQNKVQAFSMTI